MKVVSLCEVKLGAAMTELSSERTRRAQLRAPQLDPAVVVLCGHLPVAIAASWQKIPYFVGPIMVFGHAMAPNETERLLLLKSIVVAIVVGRDVLRGVEQQQLAEGCHTAHFFCALC